MSKNMRGLTEEELCAVQGGALLPFGPAMLKAGQIGAYAVIVKLPPWAHVAQAIWGGVYRRLEAAVGS